LGDKRPHDKMIEAKIYREGGEACEGAREAKGNVNIFRKNCARHITGRRSPPGRERKSDQPGKVTPQSYGNGPNEKRAKTPHVFQTNWDGGEERSPWAMSYEKENHLGVFTTKGNDSRGIARYQTPEVRKPRKVWLRKE